MARAFSARLSPPNFNVLAPPLYSMKHADFYLHSCRKYGKTSLVFKPFAVTMKTIVHVFKLSQNNPVQTLIPYIKILCIHSDIYMSWPYIRLQHERLILHHAKLILHHARLILHRARLILHHARLILHHARLILHYARLILHHARLILHHARLILHPLETLTYILYILACNSTTKT